MRLYDSNGTRYQGDIDPNYLMVWEAPLSECLNVPVERIIDVYTRPDMQGKQMSFVVSRGSVPDWAPRPLWIGFPSY